MPTYRQISSHPLRLFPDFRHLYFGRLVSAIGDKFFTMALAWYVISQGEKESQFHLGLLMAVNMSPVVLLGPFMGTWVDRMNKKTCLLLADTARLILVLGLSALFFLKAMNLPILFAMCFAVAAFIPLFESAADSALVHLTDSGHLSSAVATNASVIELSGVLGAALAGAFLAALGTLGAFLVNALSFLISLLMVGTLKADLRPGAGTSQASYLAEMRSGFRFLGDHRALALLLISFGFINFFAAPMLIFIPLMVKDILKESVSWLGILEACLSIGSVVAALATSFIALRHAYRRLYGGLFVLGVVMAAMAWTDQRFAIAGLLLVFGAALAVVNATALSVFQEVVPDAMKGRFFALLTTVSFAVMPLALALNGFFTQLFALPLIIFVNGLGVVLLSTAILLIPKVPGAP